MIKIYAILISMLFFIGISPELVPAIFLNDLEDVDTTGVNAEDFIKYNGTGWNDYDLFDTDAVFTKDIYGNFLNLTDNTIILNYGGTQTSITTFPLSLVPIILTLPPSTTAISGNAIANIFTKTNTFTSSGFTASISIAEKIEHYGDTHTYFVFNNDDIRLYSGGYQYIHIDDTQDTNRKILINENSNKINTTFVGNILASVLFIDTYFDRVGIGKFAPTCRLDVQGDTNISGDLNVISFYEGVGNLNVEDTITMGNLVLPISIPSIPVAGSCWYNTSTNELGLYNGTAWRYI